MASGFQEEPILSRLNRLDHILKQLEGVKSVNHSPKSSYSYASTNSSETLSAAGNVSPERRCRPVEEVLVEVQHKGTLIQRLTHAEDRIFKLFLQLEEELEREKKNHEALVSSKEDHNNKKGTGLKKLVKSCVGGKRSKKKNTF